MSALPPAVAVGSGSLKLTGDGREVARSPSEATPLISTSGSINFEQPRTHVAREVHAEQGLASDSANEVGRRCSLSAPMEKIWARMNVRLLIYFLLALTFVLVGVAAWYVAVFFLPAIAGPIFGAAVKANFRSPSGIHELLFPGSYKKVPCPRKQSGTQPAKICPMGGMLRPLADQWIPAASDASDCMPAFIGPNIVLLILGVVFFTSCLPLLFWAQSGCVSQHIDPLMYRPCYVNYCIIQDPYTLSMMALGMLAFAGLRRVPRCGFDSHAGLAARERCSGAISVHRDNTSSASTLSDVPSVENTGLRASTPSGTALQEITELEPLHAVSNDAINCMLSPTGQKWRRDILSANKPSGSSGVWAAVLFVGSLYTACNVFAGILYLPKVCKTPTGPQFKLYDRFTNFGFPQPKLSMYFVSIVPSAVCIFLCFASIFWLMLVRPNELINLCRLRLKQHRSLLRKERKVDWLTFLRDWENVRFLLNAHDNRLVLKQCEYMVIGLILAVAVYTYKFVANMVNNTYAYNHGNVTNWERECTYTSGLSLDISMDTIGFFSFLISLLWLVYDVTSLQDEAKGSTDDIVTLRRDLALSYGEFGDNPPPLDRAAAIDTALQAIACGIKSDADDSAIRFLGLRITLAARIAAKGAVISVVLSGVGYMVSFSIGLAGE